MKGLRFKVILSGIVLVFAFIATIGTTFAWFTISQTVTVDSMELNVTADDNLLIRVYETGDETDELAKLSLATNYKTQIKNMDLWLSNQLGTWDPVEEELINPWRLQPVTTINTTYDDVTNGQVFNRMSNTTGRVLTEVLPGDVNSNTGYYIELKFWLFSQADEARDVVMSDILSITANNVGPNADALDAVVDAVRLSVWLDDSDYGTGVGPGTASIFGLNNSFDFVFSGDYVEEDNNSLEEVGSAALVTTAEESINVIDTVDLEEVVLFTIQPETPTLVTVVIYIEGWNAAADNDIINAFFNIEFGFKFKD